MTLTVLMAGAVFLAASSTQAGGFSEFLDKETNYEQQMRYSADLSFEQLMSNAVHGGFNAY